MAETCTRCGGCLLTQYDAVERVDERYCANCGARPQQALRRADGLALDAPLLCGRGCGREVAKKWSVIMKCEEEMRTCAVCREKFNTRTAALKRARRMALANQGGK